MIDRTAFYNSFGFFSCGYFAHFAFNNARALPIPLMPACCCLILRDGRVKGNRRTFL
jgi:hypothetical protein